jgi:dTDP-4-amino-4,6-dideoxygalactose transaminase
MLEMIEQRQKILEAARMYLKPIEEKQYEFIAGKTYIPAAKQILDEYDVLGLIETALDGQYASGPKTKRFENALGHQYFPMCARPMLVNSGSSANLIAVSSLLSPNLRDMGLRPLQKGDEIITVAAGFPTTVFPLIQNGLVPVFVDVDYKTLNALASSIKSAQTEKTRGVMLAHTLGNPYRADLIAEWCAEQKLFLIEDCCDALGASIHGLKVGQFGDLATLSFYPAHHISAGEGGAVIAKHPKLRKICASFRDWGRDCWCDPAKDNTCGKRFSWDFQGLPKGYDHKYIYTHIGYNLKVTEFQASLGSTQLSKFSSFWEKRRSNWKTLWDGIASSSILSGKLIPVEPTPFTEPSWFGFAMHCSNGIDRHKLICYLEEHKVGTRCIFSGNLTRQPVLQGKEFRIHDCLTNTDRIMENTFWVGLHPGNNEKHMNYILEQLEYGILEQIK